MKIEHLVLPMAGLGKRLRPLTDHCAKSLVEINGKPLVWYVLEETRGTSIRTVTAVVSKQHASQFRSYFKTIQKEFPYLTFHVRIQKDLFGDGHSVLQALEIIKNKPCAVRFADDVLVYKTSLLKSLISAATKKNASTLLVQKVPKKDVSRYGVVTVTSPKKFEGGTLYEMKGIVEKPPVKEARSNLIVIGGYVLTAPLVKIITKMFAKIKDPQPDILRIAHGFSEALEKKQKAYTWEFPGKRLDCGTLESFYKSEEFLKKHSKRQ